MPTPTSQDIDRTKHEITNLQSPIKDCTDPAEKRRLQHQIKELQYQQLWRLDLLQIEDAGDIKKAFKQLPEVIAAIKNHERLPSYRE